MLRRPGGNPRRGDGRSGRGAARRGCPLRGCGRGPLSRSFAARQLEWRGLLDLSRSASGYSWVIAPPVTAVSRMKNIGMRVRRAGDGQEDEVRTVAVGVYDEASGGG